VWLNPYTGERRNLFAGEVERVGAVSPDGRYVILTLDITMLVDWVQDPDSTTTAAPIAPQNLLFDLQTNRLVYALKNEGDREIFYQFVYLSSQWLDAEHMLILSVQGTDRLLTI